MNQRLYSIFMAALFLTVSMNAMAEDELDGTTETITLTTAGTLREALSELESTRVASLTLIGPVNSQDLSLIRQQTGRLSKLAILDLSQVTIETDGEQYASFGGENNTGTLSSITHNCVLSDENYITYSRSNNALGGLIITYTHYGNQLAGAFQGMTTLQKVVLPDYLEEVADFIFQGCSSLSEVVLPNQATRVGDYAFDGCPALASLQIPEGVTYFGDRSLSGTGIATFDFSKVSHIGKEAFKECMNFGGDLDLSQLDTIPDGTFYYCPNITSVKFGPSLRYIGNQAFLCYKGKITELILPEGLTTIGTEAFFGNLIEKVEAPQTLINVSCSCLSNTPWMTDERKQCSGNDIIYLGSVALSYGWYQWNEEKMPENTTLVFKEGCKAIANDFCNTLNQANGTALVGIQLPSTLVRIGNNAFTSCLALRDFTLPDGLEYIGEYAFSCATSLSQVDIPESVTEIGREAFRECSGLVRVTYRAKHATEEQIFSKCEGLERLTIGANVEYLPKMFCVWASNLLKVVFEEENKTPFVIESAAFSGCSNLLSFPFPENTKEIGGGAFASCQSMTKVELPDSLEVIRESAFGGTGITELTLPKVDTEIERDAFWRCPLQTVYYPRTIPADYYVTKLFENGKNTTIYVPTGYSAAFLADHHWSLCNIEEMDMDYIVGVSPVTSTPATDQDFFDLHGRKLNNPQKGINIIRHSDGTVRKVLLK